MNPPDTIQTRRLENGLTVIIQTMPAVQSAAYTLLVPAGCMYDRAGRSGTASVLCELLPRGAGNRNSRELSEAQDFLGLQSSEGVQVMHQKYAGATLKDNLPASLEILSDLILRPHLSEQQFAPSLSSVKQSLLALEDETRQKIAIELRRRAYGLPYGLPPEGSLADVDQITLDDVRTHYESCFRPEDSIIGIAGNVDPEKIFAHIEKLFGDWKTGTKPEIQEAPPGPDRDHLTLDLKQTQIGLSYPAVSIDDPDYYTAWAAVSILGGGSSSRLFSEVREKRGLCYGVHASLSALPHRGDISCYAATQAETARETLQVMLDVIRGLSENLTDEELGRCKAGAKSSLIMQQESSMGRASRIARDWHLRGRVVTLDEIHDRLEELTPGRIRDFVLSHPPREYTLMTIGPEPLEITDAVS